jgi:hypothetical protein
MDLHEQAGLVKAGINDYGEQEYMGTDKQWDLYEQMRTGEAWYKDRMKYLVEALADADNHDCKNLEKGYCKGCEEIAQYRKELRTMVLSEQSMPKTEGEYSKDVIDYVEKRDASAYETQIENDFMSLK